MRLAPTLPFALAAVLATSCIRPSQRACGDRICPPDTVCLASGTCAGQDAVAACDGQLEGAACATTGIAGSCIGGACTPATCGNGYVEGSEQCDGPVTSVDCVQYGFDLGTPGCTARCDLEIVDTCVRFGWERVSNASARGAWTDGTHLAIARAIGTAGVDVYDSAGHVTVAADGLFSQVTGHGPSIVAWGGELARSDGGLPFQPVTLPGLVGAVIDVQVASDGSLVVAGRTCEVYRQPPGAGWQMLRAAGSPALCTALRVDDSQILLGIDANDVGKTGRVERWQGVGTGWDVVFSTTFPVSDVTVQNTTLWAGSTTLREMARFDGTTVTEFNDGFGVQVVAVGAYLFSHGAIGAIGRYDGDRAQAFDPPIGGSLFTDGQSLYIYGNGVYRFTGTQFANRSPPSNLAGDLALLPGGDVVVATGGSAFTQLGATGWNPVPASIGAMIVAGRGPTDLVVSDGTHLHHVGGGDTDITPAGFTGVNDLWVAPTGEPSLYAVGDAGLALVRDNAAWRSIAPLDATCNLNAIDGRLGGIVAAAGACGGSGVVWRLDGMTWTEVYRGPIPLVAIAVTSDDEIVAAGPQGGARSAAGSWQALAVAGRSVSATTSADVFVTGGPDEIVHWDGVTWSRLAATGATRPRVVATPHAVFFVGTNFAVLMR
jgi:hypothetical protein